MIRYDVTEQGLRDTIDAKDDKWLQEARTATDQLKADHAYSECGPKWSRIKPVYANIQHNKCGFCERLLPSVEIGSGEQHVEHFRPKGQALAWPSAASDLSYEYETGQALDGGYYWLAYEPLNYLTACYTCNVHRKRDYYPIMADRGPQHGTVRELLKKEKPFLIYPLTDVDIDPEEVLCFEGVVPAYRSKAWQRRRRADIIIDFFALDIRDELVIERYAVIDRMYDKLRLRQIGDADEQLEAQEEIDDMIADNAPHANCARSFLRVYEEDPHKAHDYRKAGRQLKKEHEKLAEDS